MTAILRQVKAFDGRKSDINWSIATIKKMVEDKTLDLNMPIQRGIVWKKTQRTELIVSILAGYPVPSITVVSQMEVQDVDESGRITPFHGGKWTVLDGKQRITSIIKFINNEFSFPSNETTILRGSANGLTVIELSDKSFRDLSPEDQALIQDFSFQVERYIGLDDLEIQRLFACKNNGTALSEGTKRAIFAVSRDQFHEIGQHEAILLCAGVGGAEKYSNRDIAQRIFASMFQEPRIDFTGVTFSEYIRYVEISEEQTDKIFETLDRILEIRKLILANLIHVDDEGVGLAPSREVNAHNRKFANIAKRIMNKTHILGMIWVIQEHWNVPLPKLTEITTKFFDGGRSVTISQTYNNASRSGTGSARSIEIRKTEILNFFAENLK